MEPSVQKQPLWDTPPVHCPLVEELPAQIKRSLHVAHRVLHEEGSSQDQLDDGTQGEERDGTLPAMGEQEYDKETRGEEEDIHLDWNCQAVCVCVCVCVLE